MLAVMRQWWLERYDPAELRSGLAEARDQLPVMGGTGPVSWSSREGRGLHVRRGWVARRVAHAERPATKNEKSPVFAGLFQ